MSRREERLARNEAFFRELNERLEAATPDSAEELVVVSECADEDCVQRLTMREGEYEAIRAHVARGRPRGRQDEAIRAHDTHFVVAVGHVDVRIEDVVRHTDRFEVVAKRGVAGEIAEDLVPRSAA